MKSSSQAILFFSLLVLSYLVVGYFLFVWQFELFLSLYVFLALFILLGLFVFMKGHTMKSKKMRPSAHRYVFFIATFLFLFCVAYITQKLLQRSEQVLEVGHFDEIAATGPFYEQYNIFFIPIVLVIFTMLLSILYFVYKKRKS